MDDPNLSDLARLAIAAPGWRWLPGMLATFRGNWTQPTKMKARVEIQRFFDGTAGVPGYADPDNSDPGFEPLPSDALPDLSDPATFGCLLALVREAWSSPDLRVRRVGQRTLWEVERWDSAQIRYVHVADGPSEVAALVAALGAEKAAAERERYDATVKRVVDGLRRRDGP